MNKTTFTDIFDANSRKVADDRESFIEMYWVDRDELIKMTDALIAVREAEAVDKALSTFKQRASFYFNNKRGNT
jgi:hypothetical protein